jgi:hypothetical protein
VTDPVRPQFALVIVKRAQTIVQGHHRRTIRRQRRACISQE